MLVTAELSKVFGFLIFFAHGCVHVFVSVCFKDCSNQFTKHADHENPTPKPTKIKHTSWRFFFLSLVISFYLKI